MEIVEQLIVTSITYKNVNSHYEGHKRIGGIRTKINNSVQLSVDTVYLKRLLTWVVY